jgi:hypothetical protein
VSYPREELSTAISRNAAYRKSIILAKPIFQPDKSLKNFTINPDKNKKIKLNLELPSIPVFIKGIKGES